jgi:glycosyltransferase involved in cell wall biosynthesis
MDQKKYHVLYYSEGWGLGGIERFIINVIAHADRSSFDFDIFSTHTWDTSYDEVINELGAQRYTVFNNKKPNLCTRLLKSEKAWRELLLSKKYDVVHINTMNGMGFIYSSIAKECGIPISIVHSHNSRFGEGHERLKTLGHRIGKQLWSNSCDIRLACSQQAGQYLFDQDSFTVVPNGIDPPIFSFDNSSRQAIRRQYEIDEETLLFGSIGRLDTSKNPLFQLEVLSKIVKQNIKAKLMLVGDGPLVQQLRTTVERDNLENNVILAGTTTHPEDFLSAFDAISMPSKFEGLPFSVIEAACSGLPILISDSFDISTFPYSHITKLSLDNPEIWASTLLTTHRPSTQEREYGTNEIINLGYDISSTVKLLQTLYTTN